MQFLIVDLFCQSPAECQCFSQVTKWLMSKGQVLTWTTYDTLLLALFMDKRVDEAESIWNNVIQTHALSAQEVVLSDDLDV